MFKKVCFGALIFATPASAMTCKVSYYGGGEYLNRHTANGEVFGKGFTIALRNYNFGHHYRVSYKGRKVTVRHNDVGPASWTGRCGDLNRNAASSLGIIKQGVATVNITKID